MLRGLLVSLSILAPCYWHSRIQAGDLSSHIYNAWLALQLEKHPVAGLVVVTQWTNVLFDWMLTELMRRFGPDWAQRLAVSLCVLVFFWGGLLLVRTLAGRPVRWLTPAMATLSYGWLFHSGFFNCYLSFGICFLGVALWLRQRRLAALLLIPLAVLAHPLPVLWAAGAVIFLKVAHQYPRRAFALALGLVAVGSILLKWRLAHLWSILQFDSMMGFDQLDVFRPEYLRLTPAMLGIFGILLLQRTKQAGTRPLLMNPELQLTALLALTMVLIPLSVAMPGRDALSYLPNRLSVTVVILAMGFAGQAAPPRWLLPALSIFFLVFSLMIYLDTKQYNQLENRLTAALEQGAKGQRVVIAAKPLMGATNLELNMLPHMIDRACVGRCYSYGNYEPSTAYFRVRAIGPNPLVVSNYDDSLDIQTGEYRAKPADLPLIQANLCGFDQPIRLTWIQTGELVGTPRCSGEGNSVSDRTAIR